MLMVLKWLVLVPLAILLVMFAVANRHAVTVSFDPFSGEAPAFALTGPLFVVLVLVLVGGVVVGGAATWLGQARHRRAARAARREAEDARAEAARLRTELDVATRAAAGPGSAYPALPDRSAA